MGEKISKEEALQFENFSLRAEALETQAQLTKAQHAEFMRSLKDKYHLGDEDKIDIRTLAIIRAPVVEPVKEAAPAEPAPAV